MGRFKKIAFLFPGQGAQYPGMGKDFVEAFKVAKETLEEANDILGRDLAKIILTGPQDVLTETKNSQTGIYVVSMAILRTVQAMEKTLRPAIAAGLSLGEYTALSASGYLDFASCLPLVQARGTFMNEACEKTKGTMAVVLGLGAESVEKIVSDENLPDDLWVANFNCPGQVVISGTTKGIEAGSKAVLAKGAKRVLPLQVHGAFHSGLMKSAEEKLAPLLESVKLQEGFASLVMNVSGKKASDLQEIKQNLKSQVTQSVRWEQGMRSMDADSIDCYLELGCGKTLAGFHKRIGIAAPIYSIEKVEDLEQFLKVVHG